MSMTGRIYSTIGGVALIGAVAWGAYTWAYGRGETAGDLMCRAELNPVIERQGGQIAEYRAEADARARAVQAAQAAKVAAEESLRRQMEDQANAYTSRIASLEAGTAGARRELVRLRDALATARVSADSLSRPVTASTGPAPDGPAPGPAGIAAACAERYLDMGGLAARLAEQVIGLQAYARLAHRACGS